MAKAAFNNTKNISNLHTGLEFKEQTNRMLHLEYKGYKSVRYCTVEKQARTAVPPLHCNGLCEQKFQVGQIFSPLTETCALNWLYVKL